MKMLIYNDYSGCDTPLFITTTRDVKIKYNENRFCYIRYKYYICHCNCEYYSLFIPKYGKNIVTKSAKT